MKEPLRETHRDDPIIIVVKNLKSSLSDFDSELEGLMTIKHPNYWFSPRFKSGQWDGRTHFLKAKTMAFPTGLLHIVEGYFKEKEIPYEIDDRRGEIEPIIKVIDKNFLMGITLRDYQREAIKAAVEHKRGVIRLPTGDGKTEVAIGLVKAFSEPTLYIVHKKDLLHQTAERFEKRIQQIDVGKIGDDYLDVGEDVTVATIQTLSSLAKEHSVLLAELLNAFKVLIVDECHHLSAPTFYKIAMSSPNAYVRIGFSGTPLNKDNLSNMKLMACTGGIIYERNSSQSRVEGSLCDVKINIIKNNEDISSGNWQSIYDKAIVNSEARNGSIVNICQSEFKKKKRILILIRKLAHGRNLKQLLEAKNIPCIFLHGSCDSEKRAKYKKKFEEEGDFILIASTIFNEGVDIPEINVIIIASGGKSEVETIQKVGRGMRLKKDGSGLLVYDFNDASKYLSKHSACRIKVYSKEGYMDEIDE